MRLIHFIKFWVVTSILVCASFLLSNAVLSIWEGWELFTGALTFSLDFWYLHFVIGLVFTLIIKLTQNV